MSLSQRQRGHAYSNGPSRRWIAQQQEARLREIALRRFPATMVFLRSEVFGDSRTTPRGFRCFNLLRRRHGPVCLPDHQELYDQWKIKSAEALERRLIALLRAWGQAEANRELAIKELKSDAWQKEAQDLLRLLVEGSRADLLGNFSELLVVPDGIAWYIPFEALGFQKENKFQSVISTKPVRYLPVLSLTVPAGVGRRLAPRTWWCSEASSPRTAGDGPASVRGEWLSGRPATRR